MHKFKEARCTKTSCPFQNRKFLWFGTPFHFWLWSAEKLSFHSVRSIATFWSHIRLWSLR